MIQKLTKPIPVFRAGIKTPLLICKLVMIIFMISTMQVNAAEPNSKSDNVLQQISVTGTVKDQDGLPMPGVNIIVEGTTIGILTDVNGAYTISVPNANSVLVFSFVGYEDMKVPVAGKSKIEVTLVASTQALDEIVVIGYGTQKKKDVASAITVVMQNRLLNSLCKTLQPRFRGLPRVFR